MKTILVIEDNAGIRENTIEILEFAGYRVVSAENGKEGIIAATTKSPDIILCDIMMPEMDGYRLLEILRNDYNLNIPFIFLTAYSEKKDIAKGLEMGAAGYLVKPFEADELIKLIKKNLAPS